MLPIQSCFWGQRDLRFFKYVYIFSAGAGTRIFFQKNFSKKKNDPPENQEIFFFQKVDFWCFHLIKNMIWSGQTWHMRKIIFQKKNPFSWWKHKNFLGSILRSSLWKNEGHNYFNLGGVWLTAHRRAILDPAVCVHEVNYRVYIIYVCT